jgi:hypothetical protein
VTNTWARPLEVTLAAAAGLGGAGAVTAWVVIADVIPSFVLAAHHTQYTDPNRYVWVFVAIFALAGAFAGVVDALVFFLLRRLSDVVRAGQWAQFVAALVASVSSVFAFHWSLARGDTGTNPVLFVGIMSFASCAGFVTWILFVKRAGAAALPGRGQR